MMENKGHIVISANVSWYLYNFRKNTIKELISLGHDLTVVSSRDHTSKKLESLGCEVIDIDLDSSGKNPFKDLYIIYKIYKIYSEIVPDLILNFTPKINIYSTLAAYLLRIKCINNIAGLGTIFIDNNLLSKFVGYLYGLSQPFAHRVFFQNEEDQNYFIEKGWVTKERSIRIMGSGVDLNHFQVKESNDDGFIRFIFIGRLLKEKGLLDLVEAIKILKKKYMDFELMILGPFDNKKKNQPSIEDINHWTKDKYINYIGFKEDVEAYLAESDCIVLPSYYREGVPKSLLEAAAMGKPIITTDTIGCRDVVDDGINGFLIQPRDIQGLVDKMELVINMSHQVRLEMGLNGRKKIESQFDEKKVIQEYINVLEKTIPNG